jgi:hypothetical protein
MKIWGLLLLIVVVFASCSNDDNPDYLPKASGNPGDILVLMDSSQWKGVLGKEVRKVFAAEFPGLPQREPMFDLIFLHPTRKGLLHQMRNVLYVFTLDKKTSGSLFLRNKFTKESIAKIQNDTAFHLSTKKDEFAKGQYVMYLFAPTEGELIDYIREKKETLIDYFNKMERERTVKSMSKNRGPTQFMPKELKSDIRVPGTYKLADRTNDFVWFRHIGPNSDKDIFITWKDYVSEYQLLPDSLLAWRDETLRRYIFEDPEIPDSYLITEREDANVVARQMSFNKNFSIELRGLWRTNNHTMGGPFISYSFVDQPLGRLYYIEGFAYNPGRDKREMVRELESILWTFKTSDQLSGDKLVESSVKE